MKYLVVSILAVATFSLMCSCTSVSKGDSSRNDSELGTGKFVSGLDSADFNNYWIVESESSDYKVSFKGDTTEIISPKGLTLWRKELFVSPITVEYDARVMDQLPDDRLSDLNCFWMASDPHVEGGSVMERMNERQGIFLNCYSLQLYYLGYGGNHNSTTRFRRYDGNEEGITDADKRPAILVEYTDSVHLLRPNHWYHIRLENDADTVRYYIDGEKLVEYIDSLPLSQGYFGFRTTLSRTQIANFTATQPISSVERK